MLKRRESASSFYLQSTRNSIVGADIGLNESEFSRVQLQEIYDRANEDSSDKANDSVIHRSISHLPESLQENPFYDDSGIDNVSSINNERNAASDIPTKWQKVVHLVSNNEDILRCSLSYFIASMGVYCPYISPFLGSSDNKHLAATVAVYFHPSRTMGSMHQSLLYFIISISFSLTVSLGCFYLAATMYNKGEVELSYVINLVFISIALSAVIVTKMRIGNENSRMACNLASTSMISAIVKEGSRSSGEIPFMRLKSVFQIVCYGALATTIVCYPFSRRSSINDLKDGLNECYYLMSDLVSLISDKFVNTHVQDAHESVISDTTQRLKSRMKSLRSHLEYSKYEFYLQGKPYEFELMSQLVDSTVILSRYLSGLHNSCELQSRKMREFATHKSSDDLGAHEFGTKLFQVFLKSLSPSLKAFSFTIREILDHLPFDEKSLQVVSTYQYTRSLQRATSSLAKEQQIAMKEVFNDDIFNLMQGQKELIADEEEIAAACTNFTHSMMEYGKELARVLDILDEYYVWEYSGERDYSWVFKNREQPKAASSQELSVLDEQDEINQFQETSSMTNSSQYSNSPRTQLNIFKDSTSARDMPFRYKLWKFFRYFKRSDTQLAIRVGIGAFILSAPAFIHQTRDFFTSWRIEWALVIYAVMMNKSEGGTYKTIKYRLVGTCLGALSAIVTWHFWGGNPVMMAISGFCISIPCFYVILRWKSDVFFGRITLLTYNLTALYSYSMTQDDEEDDKEGGNSPWVLEIGFHRVVSVSIGICWATFVAYFILPQSARSRLKKGLSLLWLQLGIIWNSDLFKYDPESLVLERESKFGTHVLFGELESLLAQAPLEFRLKGSFPTKIYSQMIKDSETILSSMDNMRMMISKDSRQSASRRYILNYIHEERTEWESRIMMNFYMIASAMKLGLPLPSKSVPTEHSKDRMLVKLANIRKLQREEKRDVDDSDFTLVYTYVMIASRITDSIESIVKLEDQLFEKVTPEELRL